MPPSEIRKEARQSLKGKWGKALRIIAAYMLVAYAIESIKKFIGSDNILSTIIDILNLLITVPLSFGLIISFIKLKRNENVKAWDFLEDGFSRFGKSWGIAWHTFVRMLLPIVCLILTIILISVLMLLGSNSAIITILGIALYIATLIYGISRSLLYILAYYIAYDKPELSSKKCVKKSEELMRGNRGNYFLLCLSFIGWILLITIPFVIAYSYFITLLIYNEIMLSIIGLVITLITFLIATLYLTSYMDVATVCFYDRLTKPEVKKIDEEVRIEE